MGCKITLKTFNLDEEIYKEFSKLCRENGISMSKRVEKFIREELESLKRDSDLNKSVKIERSLNKPRQKLSGEEHSFSKYC
ncbi:MAG: hypothetical protein Q8P57_01025 [Candidatus Pacearchaeota archaeon]|nr:hypothetical protein [Candidatus Pacearchaeota archaeon]